MVDDYITYIVKSGDTLYSIAKEYGVSVDDIKGLNNLSSNMLSIGKRLIIPFSDISSEDVDYITYVVKKGDNLYNIAKTYGVDVKDIMSFNGLSSNLLSIGQRLKIPNSSNKNSVYIVRKGDTLYSIARDYNTSVADIMNKNNLSSSVLSIGQKLII